MSHVLVTPRRAAVQGGSIRRTSCWSTMENVIPTAPWPGGGSTRGVTCVALVCPSLSMTQVISVPAARRTSRGNSCGVPGGWSPTCTTRSPGSRPAASAGEFGATDVISADPPTISVCGTMNMMANATIGNSAFIADPAASTMALWPRPRRARLPGAAGLFSPDSLTNPPSGSQLTE